MSPEILTLIMFGGILLGVLSGFPFAFPLGFMVLVFGYPIFGSNLFNFVGGRLFSIMTNYVLLAGPLFIYMGSMIQFSGIAEKMWGALYVWLSGIRGGLAMITVMIGTALAACVGATAATVPLLTMIAAPAMVNRGYSKSLATGAICAGGTLGILIPPSVMLVFYGYVMQISVGQLFMGAFVPGFILSAIYVTYIAIRSNFIQPHIAPPVPASERAVPIIKKTTMAVTAVVPTALLILGVLGAIYLGIAPPTEAAAVGGLVATIIVLVYGRLSWQVMKDVTLTTARMTAMICLLAGLSYVFVGIFIASGGDEVVENIILSAPGGRWGAFATIMFIVFMLGFFIDWIGIVFILAPIVAPIATTLGFDPIWFGMMICINLQTSFMTPPVAGSIYYCKVALDPKLGVTFGDICRGCIPYVFFVVTVLGLCVAYPQLILWLPSVMIR